MEDLDILVLEEINLTLSNTLKDRYKTAKGKVKVEIYMKTPGIRRDLCDYLKNEGFDFTPEAKRGSQFIYASLTESQALYVSCHFMRYIDYINLDPGKRKKKPDESDLMVKVGS